MKPRNLHFNKMSEVFIHIKFRETIALGGIHGIYERSLVNEGIREPLTRLISNTLSLLPLSLQKVPYLSPLFIPFSFFGCDAWLTGS